jgi:hypothetical protein
MKLARVAAAAIALTGMVCSAAASAQDWKSPSAGKAHEGATRGGVFGPVIERERGRDRPRRGRFGDAGFLGYSEGGWRHHRSALHDGFFGHGGADGRGGYHYDRGYPYDHYSDENRQEAWEAEAEPREISCRTEWTRDPQRREEVPVNVCRG